MERAANKNKSTNKLSGNENGMAGCFSSFFVDLVSFPFIDFSFIAVNETKRNEMESTNQQIERMKLSQLVGQNVNKHEDG